MANTLEKIRELASPFENRVRSVDSDSLFGLVGWGFLGGVECLARGAFIGATAGAIVGGFNHEYVAQGILVGGILDVVQDTVRKVNWTLMQKNKYQEHVTNFKRIFAMNYGRYAE